LAAAATPRFERISADGERYFAHRFGDGRYRMANPALGRIKHHSTNQLSVDINEIIGYLKKGYLLRMRGETSKQVNLVAASEITIRCDWFNMRMIFPSTCQIALVSVCVMAAKRPA
jgi:hypothetical protein